MRKMILLMLLLLVMTIPARADVDDYQLREPDAEQYLSTIADNSETLTSFQIRTILAEVDSRFRESLSQVSYELLRAVFDRFYDISFSDGYGYLPFQNQWERAIILAYFAENQIDLEQLDTLLFDDYDMLITPVDFDGNGQDEFILDVLRECRYEPCRPAVDTGASYQELLVVQKEESGNIQIAQSPLPWLSSNYHYAMPQTGNLESLQIEDINGDGLPEWLVMSRFYGGRDTTGVRLYVLGWRDDQLVDLGENAISYETPVMENFDVWTVLETDPVLIEQRVLIRDNWYCVREEITHYAWTGEQFAQSDESIHFPDSFECLARQAEESMYAHEFETAIAFYEEALALEEQADYRDYVQFRLTIAYALIGDVDRANDILGDLRESEFAHVIITSFDDSLSLTQVEICLSAYNYVSLYPRSLSNSTGVYVGQIDNTNAIASNMFAPPDSPTTAGCDMDWLIEQTLGDLSYRVTQSPVEGVREAGWGIEQTLSADFNNDGVEDWLVWLESDMLQPLQFISDGEFYTFSRFMQTVGVEYFGYPPDAFYQVDSVRLPDGEIALAVLDYVITHPYIIRADIPLGGGTLCPNSPDTTPQEPPDFPAYLHLYRLNSDGAFERQFFTEICEQGNIHDFVQGDRIIGWDEPLQNDWYLTEQVFTWDSSVHNFLPSAIPTPTFEPLMGTIPRADGILHEAIWDFGMGEFSTVLEALETIRPEAETETDVVIAVQYLRAMTLEALNRHDEALAEYVAIYEDAPDSAWGMLAALHFELVG